MSSYDDGRVRYDERVLQQLLAADDGAPDYRNDGLSMAEHAQGYGQLRPLDTLPAGRPVTPADGQPEHLFVYESGQGARVAAKTESERQLDLFATFQEPA